MINDRDHFVKMLSLAVTFLSRPLIFKTIRPAICLVNETS